MGQRGAHETFLAIVSAFVGQRRWTQAALARHAGVGTEVVRKHLIKLKAEGWPLEEKRDPPHVVWHMPAQWHPGVLAFGADEIPELLRFLARSPRSAARNRFIERVVARLPIRNAHPTFDGTARTHELTPEEDERLALLEHAAAKRQVVRMHYVTASRRDDGVRDVSVHRVEASAYPRFLATCHRTGKLKWFRTAGMSDARITRTETFRDADEDVVDSFERNTLGGYHEEGPALTCAFVVRQPEAAWVKRNLLKGMKHEAVEAGIRVTTKTAAVHVVARFVVQLGEAARAETPELAERVVKLARGALGVDTSTK